MLLFVEIPCRQETRLGKAERRVRISLELVLGVERSGSYRVSLPLRFSLSYDVDVGLVPLIACILSVPSLLAV